jgi:hypothetical protein
MVLKRTVLMGVFCLLDVMAQAPPTSRQKAACTIAITPDPVATATGGLRSASERLTTRYFSIVPGFARPVISPKHYTGTGAPDISVTPRPSAG